MTYKTIKAGSILILIVLLGCNDVEKSNSNITIRQWQYADGTIMKEMEYLSDSIPHGTYRFYYPSGVLQDSAQLTYNKFHGKRFEYHENGKLYKLTTYFNGKYRTGVDFRADGSLQYYFAFNYHEEPTFMIQYDSLGKIKKHEGFPIFS
jgi:antitoxin component YwqK of YwqJK toxin-antitoxin module